MSTKETLIAARAVIEDEANWCIGRRENAIGQHCALGAIEVARGGRHAILALAAVMLGKPIDEVQIAEGKIMGFNDQHDPGRHACVLAAFDAAIEGAS